MTLLQSRKEFFFIGFDVLGRLLDRMIAVTNVIFFHVLPDTHEGGILV